MREALKQPQFDPLPASGQVAVLFSDTAGVFDSLYSVRFVEASVRIRSMISEKLSLVQESIETGKTLTDSERAALVKLAQEAIAWKTASH